MFYVHQHLPLSDCMKDDYKYGNMQMQKTQTQALITTEIIL